MEKMARNSEKLTYPLSLRRLRQNPAIRDLTRDVRVSPHQLIQPHFVVENLRQREAVPGLTGVYRETPDSLLSRVEMDLKAGCSKLLLFSVPAKKGEKKFDFHFTAKQVAALRKEFGKDLFISVDVCLCSSTVHGHCGILNAEGDHVENSATVSELARAAAAYAQAGADCVAPSDMMDGRVRAIREALTKARCERTLLMSYSAKFHSRFYGPFRVAADSAPKGNHSSLQDRATYQIDPGRPSDALLSSLRDAEEGADILMVKPGLPYLDVLRELSDQIPLPWAVYEVSGEYAAIELMAKEGLMDGPKAHIESWTALARAGASMIITYGARNAHKWLGGLD
jgi:porphobilinogen synthase